MSENGFDYMRLERFWENHYFVLAFVDFGLRSEAGNVNLPIYAFMPQASRLPALAGVLIRGWTILNQYLRRGHLIPFAQLSRASSESTASPGLRQFRQENMNRPGLVFQFAALGKT